MHSRVDLSPDQSLPDPISPAAALMAGKKVGVAADALLIQDHEEVLGYFGLYFASSVPAEKLGVATRICLDLKVHTQIEEEILYPAAREATGDNALLDEAEREHAEAKALVAQIEAAAKQERLDDDLVLQLQTAIAHHVEEEETELFPRLRASGMDLYAAGRLLAIRRTALFSQFTGKPIVSTAGFENYQGTIQ